MAKDLLESLVTWLSESVIFTVDSKSKWPKSKTDYRYSVLQKIPGVAGKYNALGKFKAQGEADLYCTQKRQEFVLNCLDKLNATYNIGYKDGPKVVKVKGTHRRSGTELP
jgi:hypothetical protein